MDRKRYGEIEEESRHSESPLLAETNITIRLPESTVRARDKAIDDFKKKIIHDLCFFFSLLLILSYIIYAAVISTISVVICTILLPLLLVSFLVTRALQLFRHGDAYDNAAKLKLFIRAWIFAGMSGFVFFSAIIYGFAKTYNPSVRKVLILETPLEDWIVINFVIFGISVFNWVLSVLTFKFIPNVPLDNYESGLNFPENVLEIIDCLILWLALSQVLKRAPSLNDSKLLGLYTRKWIEISILIVISCNVIELCSLFMVKFLKYVFGKLDPGGVKTSQRSIFMEKIMHIRYVMYCANGIKHNIDFMCCSLVILLTWVKYFGPNIEDNRVSEIGTITCVCLLVFAILWLIKTCLSMAWEVRAVYNRLESRIVEGAKQLYFLGVMGRHSHDIFNLMYCTDQQNDPLDFLLFNIFPVGLINIESKYHSKEDGNEFGPSLFLSTKMRNKVKGDLLLNKGGRPTLYDMQQIAHYFLQAQDALKNDKYTSDILDKLKSLITSSEQQNSNNGLLPKGELRKLIEASVKDDKNEDWDAFEHQMRKYATPPTDTSPEHNAGENTKEYIHIEEIENWMERARSRCLFLANTLASAEEVVRCLNNIIKWLLFTAISVLWLLLTGFATTQVLVLIASPLLAASFIFGDTCKTLFQGIIFAYVVHPFDVGDLCIIDDIKMEVRTIGVWITTFSRIDKLEEVIFPNSQLSIKKIINLKISFDWNDTIVLGVALLEHDKIMNAKREIKRYLNDNKDKMSESCVEVLRTENDIKVTVTFRHNVDTKDNTYYQCHKKKQNLRSEHVDCLQDILNKHHTKTGDTSSVDQ